MTPKSVILFFLMLQYSCLTFAQRNDSTQYLRIGSPVFDYSFNDIHGNLNNQITFNNLKGKWTVVDFWGLGCSVCVASFPKMNAIYKQYKDRVNFLLVGTTSPKNHDVTKDTYQKYQKKLQLDFPAAFDSIFYKRNGFKGNPQILIIDPTGILRYHTYSITDDNLRDILDNKIPKLTISSSARDTTGKRINSDVGSYNYQLPFLTNGTLVKDMSDTSFSFRSLIRKRENVVDIIGIESDDYLDKKALLSRHFVTSGLLNQLYLKAYTGARQISPYSQKEYLKQFYPNLILEMNDCSLFRTNNNFTEGYYYYSLSVPQEKAYGSFIMHIMQSDLKNYFGYDVSIENRKVPVYCLVIKDNTRVTKLKTQGRKPVIYTIGHYSKLSPTDKRYIAPFFGVSVQNQSFVSVTDHVKASIMEKLSKESKLTGISNNLAFEDETGIDYNIDVFFKGDMYDLDDVIKGLHKIGLDLVIKEKEMKCVVVRDPTSANNAINN